MSSNATWCGSVKTRHSFLNTLMLFAHECIIQIYDLLLFSSSADVVEIHCSRVTLPMTYSRSGTPPAQSAHPSACVSLKLPQNPLPLVPAWCFTSTSPKEAAHFKASLCPPRWDNPLWQQTPSDIPCPVLQPLRHPKMTPTHPPPRKKKIPSFSALLTFSIFNFNLFSSHGNRPQLSNWLPEQVLCISCVFYLFCILISILYYYIFTNSLISMGECARESLSLWSCCDMILFNMHFIILSILLFLKRYHLVIYQENTFVNFLGSWHTYAFNKGTN